MKVYYDYVLIVGTSEGDATNDDGRQAFYVLWIPFETPRQWKLGISTNPDCDILAEMAVGRFIGYHYITGAFDHDVSELELYDFIEAQLGDYFAATAKA